MENLLRSYLDCTAEERVDIDDLDVMSRFSRADIVSLAKASCPLYSLRSHLKSGEAYLRSVEEVLHAPTDKVFSYIITFERPPMGLFPAMTATAKVYVLSQSVRAMWYYKVIPQTSAKA